MPDEAHGEEAIAKVGQEWLAANGVKSWLEEVAPGSPQLFRGLHYVVGISSPPPGTSDSMFMFVFAWLGGIAFIVAFFMILVFYIIPFLYFRH